MEWSQFIYWFDLWPLTGILNVFISNDMVVGIAVFFFQISFNIARGHSLVQITFFSTEISKEICEFIKTSV